MRNIFEKLKILEFKYKKLKETNSFNIFKVLFKESEEVKLHSQFLFTLLSPNGSHNRGYEFLNLFLDNLKIKDFEIESAQVFKEYKQIDILIKNSTQAIILENKLWAGDQEKQIQRYYETISSEGIKEITIIYLTLDGKEPSDKSLGKLRNQNNFKNILINASYKNNIRFWIEECIKLTALYPSLRETLDQYYKLIGDLTGLTMNKDELFEMMEVLAENDNMLQAQKIAANWNHIKWYTEWRFWEDLEEKIKKEFNILENQKYTIQSLNSVIHGSRNKNPWYGIMFEIAKKEDVSFCIFIERGESDLYYGLTVLDNSGKNRICDHERFNTLSKNLSEMSEIPRNKFWVAGNYFKPKINFQVFSNEETLRLNNNLFRENYIQINWQNIKEFIEKCKILI